MNVVSFYKLRCGSCSEFVRYKDFVILDVMNTIIHQRCYGIGTFLEIKDKGTFNEIINKYTYFEELRR